MPERVAVAVAYRDSLECVHVKYGYIREQQQRDRAEEMHWNRLMELTGYDGTEG